MSLFRRTSKEIQIQSETVSQVKEESIVHLTTSPIQKRTAEEIARDWWRERHGEVMPEEVVTWLKHLTHTEARRLNTATALLSTQKQTRLQDAKRLAETKLHNIESSLQRLHEQQDMLHRFNEKKHELTEHKNRLYEINKQLASLTNAEKDLLRFETFETIQGVFQRMQILEKLAKDNKLTQSSLIADIEHIQHLVNDLQKALPRINEDCNEAMIQMSVTRDQLKEANRVLGARMILDLDEQTAEQLFQSIGQQKDVLTQEMQEYEEEMEDLQKQITQQRMQRQAMDPHQNLMEHGEAVLTLLDRLQELGEELNMLSRQQEEAVQRQQEENNMLSRVFSEYQHVEADINALNAELQLHRKQNLGRTSYALQERAMQFKSRRQMLISAQSLWNRISSGHQLIEEKTQIVNRLRLNLDNLKTNIENLENKVIPMRQLCHEKEYTLTLSKSQNVIQLRGDLKEGVNCTVCGATHHPYHSDTMLEQSKLIGEMRTDFELLKTELVAKEQQLLDLKLEYAAQQARYDVEEDTLSKLRRRQIEDMKEWNVFVPLDRSFNDGSSSPNFEARTAMIRQLIENAVRDADDAQKELDEYNFHQTRINEVMEELTRKEQHKNDLTTRLNEVNTGCQVMARQVEHRRQLRSRQQTTFTHLYERLNSLITLNEWYSAWKNNHEGLRLRIEQMMEQWVKLNHDISDITHRQDIIRTALEHKQAACTFLDMMALQIREERERRKTIRKEGEKTYENMLGQKSVKEYFDANYQLLQAAEEKKRLHLEEMQKALIELAELQGRQKELSTQGESLDAGTISERSKLDIWMRQFNANHPPVQYAELERTFADNKDWNATRETVRAIRMEALLEQARVDALRSTIVALQAEGMRPSGSEDDMTMESLVTQQKQLEKQRQDVLMQLAEIQLTLNKHEECVARLKAEEEELYAMIDK